MADASLDRTSAPLLALLFRAAPRLQELDLSENKLQASTLLSLARSLEARPGPLPGLRVLRVSENEWGAQGGEALAALLAQLPHLQELHAESCLLRGGVLALAPAIACHKRLEVLNLSDNDINDEGARALAAALARSPCIRKVDLQCNGLEAEGARAMAQMLHSCKTLEILVLWENRLGDDGAAAMAELIVRCPRLHTLDLKFNMITAEGARHLANALVVRA